MAFQDEFVIGAGPVDTNSLLFPSNLELKPPGLEPCWVTPSHSLLPSLNRLYLNRLSSLASTSAESEDSEESCSDSPALSPNFTSLLPRPSAHELLRQAQVPLPPGLTDLARDVPKPRCQLPVQAKPKPKGPKSFNFAVVFQGYDLKAHADFELVPRLIGRRGCNMAPIYNTGAGARVRGRGSGYKEVRTPYGDYERDETLQLAVSCRSKEIKEAALKETLALVKDISQHFRRFCRKNKLQCTDLYVVQ